MRNVLTETVVLHCKCGFLEEAEREDGVLFYSHHWREKDGKLIHLKHIDCEGVVVVIKGEK